MRICAYVRVSTVEQTQGYSLAAQRQAIERHCKEKGYEIVAWSADEGISARHDSVAKRPGFRSAIEMVETGRADAIAVHKLDRFARNARVFHEALHRIRNRAIFVADGIDPSTTVGELMAGVMAQFAQFFSRNLGTESKKGLDQRRREGLMPGGRIPFGVRKDPDAPDRRRALPVPDTEPVLCTVADHREWSPYDALLLLFRRAAEEVSSIRIANELHQIGFELTAQGVRHIILNRFYIGEIPISHSPWGHHTLQWGPAMHGPLVDPTLWQAANLAALSMPCLRRVNSTPKAAQVWPVTGLLTCGRCGGPMHIKHHRDGTRIDCAIRDKRQGCDQPSFKLNLLEGQLAEVMEGLALPEEVVVALEKRLRPTKNDARRELRKLDAQRSRLIELYVDGTLTREQYAERLARVDAERRQIEERMPADEPVKFGALLRDLPRMYAAADHAQRNRLLRLVFEGFLVDDRTIVAMRPRPKLAQLLGVCPSNVDTIPGIPYNVGRISPRDDGWWTTPPVTPGNGRYTYLPGSAHPEIVAAWRAGVTMRELGRRYGVHARTISKIVRRACADEQETA